MTSAVQDWLSTLPVMQQSVLLSAIRGPDGIRKYHPSKYMLRWFRRCILVSALDKCVWDTPFMFGGGSFTGPSRTFKSEVELLAANSDWEIHMEPVIADYLKSMDELPRHYHNHFRHAAEILGYKHPDERIRRWWHKLYLEFANDEHLYPEPESEMDLRLSDDREQWAKRSHPAVTA